MRTLLSGGTSSAAADYNQAPWLIVALFEEFLKTTDIQFAAVEQKILEYIQIVC